VLLEFSTGFHVEVKEWDENGVERWKTFRRQKREWIKFAAAIREGEDNSKRNPIARIRSDCEEKQTIIYKISGKGIDSHPFGIFVINQKSGEINITKVVDRETNPFFVIDCYAINPVTQQSVETPLQLRVRVLDINDNPPVFTKAVFAGSISESSMEDTLVMKITATDADEPNTLNSKIAYKIESQTPGGPLKFILNTLNGELHIANMLDREEYSSYSLVVKATDRNGGPDGISSECTCEVNVVDVNDNIPTFSQSSYSARISENTRSDELIRIQITDLDQMHTDNWKAECYFLSGNENNNFAITVDPMTNEAILMVVEELDYEQSSNIQLSIGVRNVAPFHYSVANQYQATGTPFTVEVINIREGPTFHPSTITVTASEGRSTTSYSVGTFQAIDQDTGRPATNVRMEDVLLVLRKESLLLLVVVLLVVEQVVVLVVEQAALLVVLVVEQAALLVVLVVEQVVEQVVVLVVEQEALVVVEQVVLLAVEQGAIIGEQGVQLEKLGVQLEELGVQALVGEQGVQLGEQVVKLV
ncbi:UNVERIFIED_CONTAM: hypothetical protein K2H54_047755, partial [Gekko kuhli]